MNLDSRPDRWAEASWEFKTYNLTVERFSAVDGNKCKHLPYHHPGFKRSGLIGCNLSHGQILRKAKEEGLKSVLIFEDDIILCNDFQKEFDQRISELPDDWDMFYLSGNNFYRGKDKGTGLTPVTEFIHKTTETLTTHAYAVKSHMYDKLIEGVESLKLPLDMAYRTIQRSHNCYISRPHLGWQRPGHSDIMGGFRDYKNIKK